MTTCINSDFCIIHQKDLFNQITDDFNRNQTCSENYREIIATVAGKIIMVHDKKCHSLPCRQEESEYERWIMFMTQEQLEQEYNMAIELINCDLPHSVSIAMNTRKIQMILKYYNKNHE